MSNLTKIITRKLKVYDQMSFIPKAEVYINPEQVASAIVRECKRNAKKFLCLSMSSGDKYIISYGDAKALGII